MERTALNLEQVFEFFLLFGVSLNSKLALRSKAFNLRGLLKFTQIFLNFACVFVKMREWV